MKIKRIYIFNSICKETPNHSKCNQFETQIMFDWKDSHGIEKLLTRVTRWWSRMLHLIKFGRDNNPSKVIDFTNKHCA
jgi:hypothetical protein